MGPPDSCVENVDVDAGAVGTVEELAVKCCQTLVDAIETPVVGALQVGEQLLRFGLDHKIRLDPPHSRAVADVGEVGRVEVGNDEIDGALQLGIDIDAIRIEVVGNDVDCAITVHDNDVGRGRGRGVRRHHGNVGSRDERDETADDEVGTTKNIHELILRRQLGPRGADRDALVRDSLCLQQQHALLRFQNDFSVHQHVNRAARIGDP